MNDQSKPYAGRSLSEVQGAMEDARNALAQLDDAGKSDFLLRSFESCGAFVLVWPDGTVTLKEKDGPLVAIPVASMYEAQLVEAFLSVELGL